MLPDTFTRGDYTFRKNDTSDQAVRDMRDWQEGQPLLHPSEDAFYVLYRGDDCLGWYLYCLKPNTRYIELSFGFFCGNDEPQYPTLEACADALIAAWKYANGDATLKPGATFTLNGTDYTIHEATEHSVTCTYGGNVTHYVYLPRPVVAEALFGEPEPAIGSRAVPDRARSHVLGPRDE